MLGRTIRRLHLALGLRIARPRGKTHSGSHLEPDAGILCAAPGQAVVRSIGLPDLANPRPAEDWARSGRLKRCSTVYCHWPFDSAVSWNRLPALLTWSSRKTTGPAYENGADSAHVLSGVGRRGLTNLRRLRDQNQCGQGRWRFRSQKRSGPGWLRKTGSRLLRARAPDPQCRLPWLPLRATAAARPWVRGRV
jgi:hypothetical protein